MTYKEKQLILKEKYKGRTLTVNSVKSVFISCVFPPQWIEHTYIEGFIDGVCYHDAPIDSNPQELLNITKKTLECFSKTGRYF